MRWALGRECSRSWVAAAARMVRMEGSVALSAAATLIAIALIAACGGKVGDSAPSDPRTLDASAASAGTASAGSSGGNGNDSVEPLPDGGCPDSTIFDGVSRCLDRATAIASCKTGATQEAPSISVDDATCSAGCACTYCTAPMLLCETSPDCVKILRCAEEYNCLGLAACYAPDKCQPLIDSADDGQGISSLSAAYADVVVACWAKNEYPSYDFPNRAGPVCSAGCL